MTLTPNFLPLFTPAFISCPTYSKSGAKNLKQRVQQYRHKDSNALAKTTRKNAPSIINSAGVSIVVVVVEIHLEKENTIRIQWLAFALAAGVVDGSVRTVDPGVLLFVLSLLVGAGMLILLCVLILFFGICIFLLPNASPPSLYNRPIVGI
jgi:hypothetical protein